MRQGGVTSTGLYSAHIDEITSKAELLELGICINDDLEQIPTIQWVDDIVLVETDPVNMQKLLDCVNEVAQQFKIEFGEDKSKFQVIGGKKDAKPTFKLEAR